jgi:hypothetical protein
VWPGPGRSRLGAGLEIPLRAVLAQGGLGRPLLRWHTRLRFSDVAPRVAGLLAAAVAGPLVTPFLKEFVKRKAVSLGFFAQR